MVNYDRLPAASQYFDGPLFNKMNEDLQLAGMSKRTVHDRGSRGQREGNDIERL